MAVLIDTSILIEYERGRVDLQRHPERRRQEEFFISVVTASELLHGVHRAVQSDVRAKRSAFAEALLERFPLLPIDVATARLRAQVRAELAVVGNIIERNDLWLAATCIAHGLTCLVTGILAVPPDILFISQPLSPMALSTPTGARVASLLSIS